MVTSLSACTVMLLPCNSVLVTVDWLDDELLLLLENKPFLDEALAWLV